MRKSFVIFDERTLGELGRRPALGLHSPSGMAIGTQLRRHLEGRKSQISLLARFGAPTVRAYARIVQTLVNERLWEIPPRRLRPARHQPRTLHSTQSPARQEIA